jgi:subtilase family serine protease
VTTLGGVIPADTPPGAYFLCAVIDSGNKVVEENEGNNCACCRIQVMPKPAIGAAPDVTPIQLPAVK